MNDSTPCQSKNNVQNFPRCDATITAIDVVDTRYAKYPSERQLRVNFCADDGQTVSAYYPGVYVNHSGSIHLGPNAGTAKLMSALARETGTRYTGDTSVFIGARVHVEPRSNTYNGRTSWKIAIVGPALTSATPTSPKTTWPPATTGSSETSPA